MSDYLKSGIAHKHALVAAGSVEHAIRQGYDQAVIDARTDELAEALARYGRYAVV